MIRKLLTWFCNSYQYALENAGYGPFESIGLTVVMPYFLLAMLVLTSLTSCTPAPPGKERAPYALYTGNGVFYAEKAWVEYGVVFAENYYWLKDGKWEFVEGKQMINYGGGYRIEER